MNKTTALSVLFVFFGVFLVLGSVVAVPYTQGEWVEVEHTTVWADDVFTLEPNATKQFTLDIGWVNDSIISLHVETTGDLTFKIFEGCNLAPYMPPLFEWIIKDSSVAGSKDFFWTPLRRGGACFVSENQDPVEIEALITIKQYFPRAHEYREVTRYNYLLGTTLAYPGAITVIAGIALNYVHTSTKRKMKRVNRLKLRASIFLSFFGVFLVLGSVVAVPYTQGEWVEVEHTTVWADDVFTLEPNATKRFIVDHACVNSSIINIHVNEATGNVDLEVAEGELALYTVFEWVITNTTVLEPEELFWTYPRQVSVWYFIFQNPNSVDINVSVVIKEYFPRASEWREITYYNHALDPIFAYPGIIAIIIGTILKPRKTQNQQFNTIQKSAFP